MSNEFNELQHKWETNKKEIEANNSFEDLYSKIKSKEKENYVFYYGTITILVATLSAICLFFYYVAAVKETLSRIGVGLMVSGLLIRIFIEAISIYKAKQINNLDSTLTTAENAINFHHFRKMIYKVIAPIIIVFYTIGFYIITPEFSLYIKFWHLVLFDVSYVFIGIILFTVISKGVKKEIQKLKEIIELKDELTE